jgi:hypothetical protein
MDGRATFTMLKSRTTMNDATSTRPSAGSESPNVGFDPSSRDDDPVTAPVDTVDTDAGHLLVVAVLHLWRLWTSVFVSNINHTS